MYHGVAFGNLTRLDRKSNRLVSLLGHHLPMEMFQSPNPRSDANDGDRDVDTRADEDLNMT